jgi:hypothetical protein
MTSLKKNVVILTCMLVASMAAYAQGTLAGKWHGIENNLPTVDLTIEENAGHASGNAVFYLIKRNPGESVAHVDGLAPGPMENLNYEPQKLTFDVRRLDGSVVSFRVELTDADHATLFRTSDKEPGGSAFPLTRVKP